MNPLQIFISIIAINFLLIIFWCTVMQHRDKQYRKTARAGTLCRYWINEERRQGLIVTFKDEDLVVIKDLESEEIVTELFDNTCPI